MGLGVGATRRVTRLAELTLVYLVPSCFAPNACVCRFTWLQGGRWVAVHTYAITCKSNID